MKIALRFTLLLLVLISVGSDAAARGFRDGNRIATPTAEESEERGERLEVIEPIETAVVIEAIQGIASAWENGTLGDWLDSGFYNKQRLLDTIAEDVPRDAVLRILSVQNPRTLEQRVVEGEGAAYEVISRVTAIVEMQIEFTDPDTGFKTLTSRSEFLLNISDFYR